MTNQSCVLYLNMTKGVLITNYEWGELRMAYNKRSGNFNGSRYCYLITMLKHRKMKIRNKIEHHYNERKFSRISRRVAKDWNEVTRGYIVDFSDRFIIVQLTEDFRFAGFNILPIDQIEKIRYNKHDKYYDKIMGWEEQKKNLGTKTNIRLSSWKDIFLSFKKRKKNIIVECEHSKINTFTIGPIVKVGDNSVYIRYFDSAGILDKKPTKIKFKHISKVLFDDRYIDVFSKYVKGL